MIKSINFEEKYSVLYVNIICDNNCMYEGSISNEPYIKNLLDSIQLGQYDNYGVHFGIDCAFFKISYNLHKTPYTTTIILQKKPRTLIFKEFNDCTGTHHDYTFNGYVYSVDPYEVRSISSHVICELLKNITDGVHTDYRIIQSYSDITDLDLIIGYMIYNERREIRIHPYHKKLIKDNKCVIF